VQARWLAVASLSAIFLTGTTAHADPVADAVALVERVHETAFAVAHDGDAPDRSQTLREAFDAATIAKVVLGDHWSSASSADRQNFIDALLDAIVEALVKRLGPHRSQDFVIGAGRTLADGDILVRTRIERPPQEPITIDWRVDRCSASPCVVDVYVGGASVSLRRRDDVAARMAAEGASIDKLIADLRREVSGAAP